MIQFNLSQADFTSDQSSATLCIGLFQEESLPQVVDQLGLTNYIQNWLQVSEFKAEVGNSQVLYTGAESGCKRLIIIGLGKKQEITQKTVIKIIKATISAVKPLNEKQLVISYVEQLSSSIEMSWCYQLLAQHFTTATYDFYQYAKQQQVELYTNNSSKDNPLANLTVTCQLSSTDNHTKNQVERSLNIGHKVGLGINTARFLGDLPANICTPTYLAEFVSKLATEHSNLQVKILDAQELAENNMDTFLSVAQGSAEPPKLIQITYQPSTGKVDSQVNKVLIGKGVTFDTGGISLKPSATMDEMKYDMCGAASIIGVMHQLALIGDSPEPVVGLVPATENMPSSTSTKPGDVFSSLSGQTVEVLNTDAEGRLILADTLSYAEQTFSPKHMINVATLTGACVIALGHYRSAVMSNDGEFAQSLQQIGESADDPCWQMPLDDEYDNLLKSNFADIPNISSGRAAGTITAGCFLKRFVKQATWAHLDIAGTAWKSGNSKGATGRPVGLLSAWLRQG